MAKNNFDFGSYFDTAAQDHALEEKEREISQLRAELEALRSQSTAGIRLYPLSEIQPLQLREGLQQPRKYFDPDGMAKLEASIRSKGVQEPILLRSVDENRLEIVSGERRWRASQAIGLRDIPAVVKALSDEEALEIALIANLIREDLNPLEETDSIIGLIVLRLNCPPEQVPPMLRAIKNAQQRDQDPLDKTGLISEQFEMLQNIFAEFGLTLSGFVSDRLPLLNLPECILTEIRTGKIEYSKARLFGRIQDEVKQQQLLQQAIQEGWTRAEIQKQIKELESTSSKSIEIPSQEQLRDSIHSLYNKARRDTFLWNDPQKEKRLQKIWKELVALLED